MLFVDLCKFEKVSKRVRKGRLRDCIWGKIKRHLYGVNYCVYRDCNLYL